MLFFLDHVRCVSQRGVRGKAVAITHSHPAAAAKGYEGDVENDLLTCMRIRGGGKKR